MQVSSIFTNKTGWNPSLKKPDPLREYILLPCPFCEGEAVLIVGDIVVGVSCGICYAQGPSLGIHGKTTAEHRAVMAWQRRDWQGVKHKVEIAPQNISS